MRRREFIKGIVCTVSAGPVSARAQQSDRMRRIGIMISYAESDPEGLGRLEVFRKGLEALGWFERRNIRFDYRWPAGGNSDRMRALAAELVSLAPDVILTSGTPITIAMQRE